MDAKRCNRCSRVLPLREFSRDCTSRDGRCNWCKVCKYQYKKVWSRTEIGRQSSKETQKRHKAKYADRYALTKVRARRRSEQNKRINSETKFLRSWPSRRDRASRVVVCGGCGERFVVSVRGKRFCSPPCRRKTYYEKTKHLIDKQQQRKRWRRAEERRREAYRHDPVYRVQKLIRVGIRRTATGQYQHDGAWKYLPYTPVDLVHRLKQTIPKGHTWQDFLNGDLHIDHIRPVSSFKIGSVGDKDFMECWSLSNLQLLTATENLKKSDSWVAA